MAVLCVTSSTDELHDNEKPSTNWQVEKNNKLFGVRTFDISFVSQLNTHISRACSLLPAWSLGLCFIFLFTHTFGLVFFLKAATLHGNNTNSMQRVQAAFEPFTIYLFIFCLVYANVNVFTFLYGIVCVVDKWKIYPKLWFTSIVNTSRWIYTYVDTLKQTLINCV